MRLRCLTYNIHKGIGTDGARDLRRIAQVVRHYDPDVVALQEIMWFRPREGFPPQPTALAGELSMHIGAVGLNCRRRVGVYGNATLTNCELVEHANLDLTVPLKKSRSALYSLVRRDGVLVHFYNVHLGLARYERVAQARRLIAEIEEVAPAPAPVVVMGDTNDWRDVVFPAVFAPAGFRCRGGGSGSRAHGTFPSWYPVANLDRVFVRGDVHIHRAYASRLALARQASDHLPVIADLDVGDTA